MQHNYIKRPVAWRLICYVVRSVKKARQHCPSVQLQSIMFRVRSAGNVTVITRNLRVNYGNVEI